MRTRAVILTLFFPILGLSQQPLGLTVHSQKIDSDRYRLQFDFKIEKGWHVYAATDSTLSLDGLTISVDGIKDGLGGESTDTKAISTIHDAIFDNKALAVYQQDFSLEKILSGTDGIPPALTVSVRGFASNDKELIPVELSRQVALGSGPVVPANFKIPSINIDAPVSGCGEGQPASSRGWLFAFLLGLGGGLVALLTPCVFPMIPVTVSYFNIKLQTKNRAVRQGLWYGFSIVSIYVLASLPFHLLGGVDPQLFNSISTNAWVNLFFFAVFLVFAISLFGGFEIRLPSYFSNSAGARSRLGSAAGIFFMALTLAIVSFSCTGPILGSLLVGSLSSSAGAWSLTAGMAGFGCALGLPFALFAIFPQWLQGLPKSGSWMNVVKKSLAFAELALAVKFLSNADLVEHWGLLKRETFLTIWLLIFLALALYLLGMSGKKNRIAPARFVFGILCLLFCLYLASGITRNNFGGLPLLSGFAPPLSYSIYGKNARDRGLEADVVNDYAKALQLSKQQDKPLLIDFTGWACVNCRKMEENVWTDTDIKDFIKQHFILVSLYVDDRRTLPPAERTVWEDGQGAQRQINTVGDKYASFQIANFRQVTQPLYAILSPGEKLLNLPVGFTPRVKQYRDWLQCGYDAFVRTNRAKE